MFSTRSLPVAALVVGLIGTALVASPAESAPATAVPTASAAKVPAADVYYPTVREAAALDGFTIYRPTTKGKYPVVVWGNGGCRPSNEEFLAFLSQVAAHGFVVVAAGNPDARFESGGPGFVENPLVDAIRWAADPKVDSGSAAKKVMDSEKIGVMGQSCGAIQAWNAAAEPAVDSLASWNGSSGSGVPVPAVVAGVHTPTLIVTGGTTDVAYNASVADYAALPPSIPAVYAQNSAAGHIGIFHGTNDPTAAKAGAPVLGFEVLVQGTELAVAWLDATLNRNREGAYEFVRTHSNQADYPYWSFQRRGF